MAKQLLAVGEDEFIEVDDSSQVIVYETGNDRTIKEYWLDADFQEGLVKKEVELSEAGKPEHVVRGVLDYIVHWHKSWARNRVPNPVPEFAEGLVSFGEEDSSFDNDYWKPRADSWRKEGRSEEWIQEQIEANPNAAVEASYSASVKSQERVADIALLGLLWAALATAWAVYAQFFSGS